tara:strand:- start:243 stop:767 length:525 start_codon:yes stop_codon:yes gene_type:complete
MRIGTIGALCENKGQMKVIKSIAKLGRNASITYYCAGLPDKDYLNNLISNSQRLDVKFEYLGMLSPEKLRIFYNSLDLLIMPSSSEGFGLVAIESIACGTAVIVPSHLPIVHEVGLLNKNNSVIIKDNSTDEICKGILKGKSINFKRNDVSKSINFITWKEIAFKYINLYNEIS